MLVSQINANGVVCEKWNGMEIDLIVSRLKGCYKVANLILITATDSSIIFF